MNEAIAYNSWLEYTATEQKIAQAVSSPQVLLAPWLRLQCNTDAFVS